MNKQDIIDLVKEADKAIVGALNKSVKKGFIIFLLIIITALITAIVTQ